MNHDRKIDKKLKEALENPRGLNVENFTVRVMAQIREERINESKRNFINRWKIFLKSPLVPGFDFLIKAATVMLLMIIVVSGIVIHKGKRERPGNLIAFSNTNFGPSVPKARSAASIVYQTDPDKILLTGEYHVISNDPLMRPHSVWDQKSQSSL